MIADELLFTPVPLTTSDTLRASYADKNFPARTKSKRAAVAGVQNRFANPQVQLLRVTSPPIAGSEKLSAPVSTCPAS